LKAEITLEWADGEYLFALKGAQIEELEHACGKVGFGVIYQRVMLGAWFWSDLYHTVRLGLIGGGMGAIEAKRLTDFYIGKETNRPLTGPNSPEAVARAVLGASMVGFGDLENPGEGESRGSPASQE